MTDEERKALIAGIKTAITAQLAEAGITDPNVIKGALGRLHDLEQKMADAGNGPGLIRGAANNPFATDQFQARMNMLKEGHKSTGNILLPGVTMKNVKALVNVGTGGSVGFTGATQRGPTLPVVQPPLTVLDVFQSIPMSGNQYEYVQLTRTANAAVQATEGAQKAETHFDSDLKIAHAATVATYTMASRQVLADSPQLSALLSSTLAFDVVKKYEDLVVNGTGVGNSILGLEPQAVPFSHTLSPKVDRIDECIATMWDDGFQASVVLMNPFDLVDIETERSPEDSHYIGSGWSNPGPNPPSIWRLPVARTGALDQGTALVVDSRFVWLLDREQVTTAISTEDRDNFIKNLVTILCEMRGSMALLNTSAVRKVDLAST